MRTWSSELLAVSKAGHDKGKIYLAFPGEEGYCLLCDGKTRTLENPKKEKGKTRAGYPASSGRSSGTDAFGLQ